MGDILNILISWSWCSQEGVQGVLSFIKTIVDIIRIIVPIVLVIMTTMDIINKVINPDEKEGQKKIMIRAIAALIVFLIPVFIRITFKVIDWGSGKDGSYENAESGLSSCWS